MPGRFEPSNFDLSDDSDDEDRPPAKRKTDRAGISFLPQTTTSPKKANRGIEKPVTAEDRDELLETAIKANKYFDQKNGHEYQINSVCVADYVIRHI